MNDSCTYYKRNLKKISKDLPCSEYWKYKLRYLYQEFSVNFFDMELSQLPKWATSFKYKKNNAYIKGLYLTYRVNLKLSLCQTVQALYVVWFIMDKVSRSILDYQVSTYRDVGPCILTMCMAFDRFKKFPGKDLKFIADGYSAYPLAAQQFKIEKDWEVFIT